MGSSSNRAELPAPVPLVTPVRLELGDLLPRVMEERDLERTFEDAHVQCRARVRRWP